MHISRFLFLTVAFSFTLNVPNLAASDSVWLPEWVNDFFGQKNYANNDYRDDDDDENEALSEEESSTPPEEASPVIEQQHITVATEPPQTYAHTEEATPKLEQHITKATEPPQTYAHREEATPYVEQHITAVTETPRIYSYQAEPKPYVEQHISAVTVPTPLYTPTTENVATLDPNIAEGEANSDQDQEEISASLEESETDSPSDKPRSSFRRKSAFRPFFFDLFARHIEGKGIGYHQGYSTIGLFGTPYYFNVFHPFIDTRLHIFNNGKLAANIGGGVRYFDTCLNRIFGLNIYYDYRNTHRRNFNQIGVGLEMLGCQVDLRLNGYFPLESKGKERYDGTIFYPRNLYAMHFHRDHSMTGFDAEIETSLQKWCIYPRFEWNPYIAAGPYYYNGGKDFNVRGGKIRCGVSYLDFLLFEVRTYFDNIYHTTVQGVVEISFPFVFPRNACCARNDCCECDPCCSYFWSLLTQPVERQEIIGLDERCVWHKNF